MRLLFSVQFSKYMSRTPISESEKKSLETLFTLTETPAGYKGSKIGEYFEFVKLSLGKIQ